MIMGDKTSVLFHRPPASPPPSLPASPHNHPISVAYLELDVWVFFRSLVLSFPMLLHPPVYLNE